MKETKDLLSHFLYKFELFSKETNDRFNDFDVAISDIEKGMILTEEINNDNIVVNEFANNVDETFANIEEDNTNL